MGKIPADKAAAMFEQIIGWPYQSPGVTDDRGVTLGIDCSGAWVRVYRAFDKRIEHGSNSQYRKFCDEKGELAASAPLRVGMAVFKCRPWREEDRGHNQYGQAPGNLYHVGCVTSVSPLRIVHATPPKAKADTSAKGWSHWGMPREVAYGGEAGAPAGEPKETGAATSAASATICATVATERDPLNLRDAPENGAVLTAIPRGARVELAGDPWTRVRYGGREGWVSAKYLQTDQE